MSGIDYKIRLSGIYGIIPYKCDDENIHDKKTPGELFDLLEIYDRDESYLQYANLMRNNEYNTILLILSHISYMRHNKKINDHSNFYDTRTSPPEFIFDMLFDYEYNDTIGELDIKAEFDNLAYTNLISEYLIKNIKNKDILRLIYCDLIKS